MSKIPELENYILTLVKEQYLKDLSGCETLSLLSKWLPREKSGTYPKLAQKIANFIYTDEVSQTKRMIKYRKDVSKLNKLLKTVEINMCGKTWAEIKPEAVPGRCLKIHTSAFLNEPVKRPFDTLRYPDSEDRMKCRKNFQVFIGDLKDGTKKAHGANVVMPHELVEKAMKIETSADEHSINQGQWDSIREETFRLGGLAKCVPMCDFSGSMDGLPKLISLALGILLSEINHSAFKDHILTFDSKPVWYSFNGKTTLKEKLDSIDRSSIAQGYNTDFYLACIRILEKMKQHKVPVGEEPEDLIVLTDMGFDEAKSPHDTENTWVCQLEKIRNEFKKVGEEVWGEGNGWKPPRIVIWNISAQYKDFHARADQEGVVQLSGWSPSILQALQKGGVHVGTPYDGMRVILDNERYDAVRKSWDEVHSNN
jgi:hypothetical protein